MYRSVVDGRRIVYGNRNWWGGALTALRGWGGGECSRGAWSLTKVNEAMSICAMSACWANQRRKNNHIKNNNNVNKNNVNNNDNVNKNIDNTLGKSLDFLPKSIFPAFMMWLLMKKWVSEKLRCLSDLNQSLYFVWPINSVQKLCLQYYKT